jgi:hypothetical protein
MFQTLTPTGTDEFYITAALTGRKRKTVYKIVTNPQVGYRDVKSEKRMILKSNSKMFAIGQWIGFIWLRI